MRGKALIPALMERFALLVSPRAEAAYFAQMIDVARAELAFVAGVEGVHMQRGGMEFLCVEGVEPGRLARLSFLQGIFRMEGDALIPLDIQAAYRLHADFVWGEKYRGKTNETLTQLLVNLALDGRAPEGLRLLDPMCGRGTTLLLAMRYGIEAVGVEQDAQSLAEFRRGVKKWSKLHRQKHTLSEGWVQKANKAGTGRYIDFDTRTRLRLIVGDTSDVRDLVRRKSFDMIVTDAPYGVQHQGKSQRSPLETLKAAAPGWTQSLAPGGMLVLAFNSYLPKRAALEEAFS